MVEKNIVKLSTNRSLRARSYIEQAIIKGDFKPGDKLDERRLAEVLNISRTPVREAIHELALTGIIESPPRQQAFVAKIDPTSLLEIFEAQVSIEGVIAEIACRRIDQKDLARLNEIHSQSEVAMRENDMTAYFEFNVDFHRIIHEAARNLVLTDHLAHLRRRILPYRRQLFENLRRLEVSFSEHQQIIDAFIDKNEVLARNLVKDHEQVDSEQLFDLLLSVGR